MTGDSLLQRAPTRHSAPAFGAGRVFACVDASDYMPSVCHHAAWLAERLGAELRLLHASAEPRSGAQVVLQAAERVGDEGFAPPVQEVAHGAFLEIASGAAGPRDALVLGRRGRASGRKGGVGANVVPLIRRSVAAVLVAPRLFMPISRIALRRSGVEAADERLGAFVDRALPDATVIDPGRGEVDMICCARELICRPAPGVMEAVFGLRRPVLVV